MTISPCHVALGIQTALALGSAAFGRLELAAAFGVIALAQGITVVVGRCVVRT